MTDSMPNPAPEDPAPADAAASTQDAPVSADAAAMSGTPASEAPETSVQPAPADASPAPASETAAPTAAPAHDAPAHDGAAQEILTVAYERLRHSTDPAELSEFARRDLPDRADQAAFSRATALLEAVAGNPHTPVEDRIHLAESMPFPNVLVKLAVDSEPAVRKAVAGNTDDKNWLVGRLTKDEVPEVRDAALVNPKTSWKMRLEGAQNPQVDATTLEFLSRLGRDSEEGAPKVLSSMVRRAVALNPNATAEILDYLADDPSPEVVHAVQRRRA